MNQIKFYLLVFTIFCVGLTQAQNYPVKTNIQLTPPYTSYLPDYTDGTNSKLQVALQIADVNVTSLNVKLRITLDGPGGKIVTSSDYFNTQPQITLINGAITILDGTDLTPYLDFNNLTFPSANFRTQYAATKVLPEGLWKLCVDVYDYDNPLSEVLSTNSCALLISQRLQAPILNEPICNEIRTRSASINFSWTDMALSGLVGTSMVSYDFSLYLVPPGATPNITQVLATNPIYSINTIDRLLVLDTIGNPGIFMGGRKYVWQVRVKDENSPGAYLNNGYSAPCLFTYGDLAQEIINDLTINLTAESHAPNYGTASWTISSASQSSARFESYMIAYRKAGNSYLPWYEQAANGSQLDINQLEEKTSYEVKIKGLVAGKESQYTNPVTFTTTAYPVYACGNGAAPGVPPNFLPLQPQNAYKGIKVSQGQFTMTVSDIQPIGSGAPGLYKGTGRIRIDFLFTSVRVSFTDLLIDDHYVARGGDINVITKGLDEWLHDQYAGLVDPIVVSGTITDGVFTSDSTILVTTTEDTYTYEFENDLPIIIHGDGNVSYTFWPDGTIEIGTYGITPSTDNLNATASRNIQFKAHPDQVYGIDVLEYDAWKPNYEVIICSDKYQYVVPNKAISQSESDLVYAVTTGTYTDLSKLKFRIFGSTSDLDYTQINNNTFAVTIPDRLFNFKIYAYYDTEKLGKINVKAYDELSKKVRIVPLTSATLSQTDIKTALENTFKNANLKFDITVKNQYQSALFTDQTIFTDPETNLLSKYTLQMRALRDEYLIDNPVDNDEYLIFVVPGFQNTALDGYMVRGRGVGFIKTNSNTTDLSRTLAHELGHGIGGLKHAWDDDGPAQNSTTNLMDYNGGIQLIGTQWEKMRNPGIVFSLLDEEEDASSAQVGDGYIPDDWFQTDNTISFLTPGKSIIKFDKNIEKAIFSWGLNDYPETDMMASGHLYQFDYTGAGGIKTYTAKVVNNQFTGYFAAGDKEFLSCLAAASTDEVLIALPGRSTGVLYRVKNMGLPYMTNTAGGNTQAAFVINSFASSRLNGDWVSFKTHPYGSSLFYTSSQTFFSQNALQTLNILGTGVVSATYNDRYLNTVKIMELRGSFSDIHNLMSAQPFGSWDNSGTYVAYYVNELLAAASDPIQYFLSGPQINIGYFDYVFVKNNYAGKSLDELTYLYLFHFRELITAQRAMNAVAIAAIKEGCANGNNGMLSTLTETQVRDAVNVMSVLELANLCNGVRVDLISSLLYPGVGALWITSDSYEQAIDKLFWTTPREKEKDLLISMCSETRNGEVLIKTMVDAVDDETFFIGQNYNTRLMNWMIRAYKDFPHIYAGNITKAMLPEIKKRIVSYNYVGFTKRLFKSLLYSTSSTIAAMTLDGDKLSEVTVNSGANPPSLTFLNETVMGFVSIGQSDVKTSGLLEPIILNGDGGLLDIYEDNKKSTFVPAAILYFLERKADAKTTSEAIQTVVDVASLAIPGGQLAALRFLSYADKLSSVSSILGSAVSQDYPNLASVLNLTSTVLGFADLSATGISKLKNLKNSANSTVDALEVMNSGSELFTVERHSEEVNKLLDRLITPTGTDVTLINTLKADPIAKEDIIQILEREKYAAQASYKSSIIAKIDKAINTLNNFDADWLKNPFYTGLSKYSDRWSADGFFRSTSGGDIIAKIDDAGELTVYENKLAQLGNLGPDAVLIENFSDVPYKLFDGTTSSSAIDDILVFMDNGTVRCLTGVNCFTADTKIKTAHGYEMIQNVKINDLVSTFNEKTKSNEVNRVTQVFKKPVDRLQRLIIGVDTIFATAEHAFYTPNGWVKAASLSLGMLVQSHSGFAGVTANTSIDTLVQVYNFTVENTHTYFVGKGALLVHNDCKKIGDIVAALGEVKGRKFIDDLNTNSLLRQKIADGVYNPKAWELLYDVRGAGSLLKTDPLVLKKLTEILGNSSTLNKLGGQAGLADIIKANLRAGCSVCGIPPTAFMRNMDEYLDDVVSLVNDYPNANFATVVAELKIVNGNGSVNTRMEAAAYMIGVMKKESATFKGKITSFDLSIDDAVNGCKYDILYKNGINDPYIYAEFKSYDASSLPNLMSASSSSLNQFKSYLLKVNSLDELEYYFDLGKISDVNLVKERIKAILIENADSWFDIPANGGFGTAKMQQLFGSNMTNATIFKNAITNNTAISDNILRFIKLK